MATADKIKADIERMAERLAKAQAREALKANRDKAKQADAKRKADTRAKIELGGLAMKAGMAGLDKGTALGAMIAIVDAIQRDPEKAHGWKSTGDKLMAGKAKP